MDWIDDQRKLWRAGMERDEKNKRIAELKAALSVAMTALCSWQSHLEATSDGTCVLARETASRMYDQCSDAIAACDRLGVKPALSKVPED